MACGSSGDSSPVQDTRVFVLQKTDFLSSYCTVSERPTFLSMS